MILAIRNRKVSCLIIAHRLCCTLNELPSKTFATSYIERLRVNSNSKHYKCNSNSMRNPFPFLNASINSGLVWGSSVKHQPQRVGIEHILNDEDVVQIVKKV